MDTAMARLTDNNGALLGGLETPLSRLLSPLSDAQNQLQNQTEAAVTAPVAAPRPPEYGPGEIVFALRCSYGALPTLGYAAAPTSRRPSCDALVEEPEERHPCPACGGYYCAAHAQPAAHDCKAILRAK